jgi:hypothetical protein
MQDLLKAGSKIFYPDGIRKLVNHWAKRLDNQGDWIEESISLTTA